MAIDHFEETNYHGQSPWWNFNVLFNNQPAVKHMVEGYAKALQHPGLYPPVPSLWLHATILEVGSTDDYSEQDMMAAIEVLEPKLAALELPQFTFDPWWIWGGIVLHITPEDQFSKLYYLVIESLEAVLGPAKTPKTPHGKFTSHLTLAYTKTHHQELEIHRQLREISVLPVDFEVDRLSLVKQRPKDGHYEWSVFKELPIGHS